MITRTDLLNSIAEKYKLERYLEIGVQNPEQNFNKVTCTQKVSVDPDASSKADFKYTSDDFFRIWSSGNLNNQGFFPYQFDLIFIDGLHTAEQVEKDFDNALKVLSPNGFIVLHDCNPEKEEHTIVPRPTERGHWNGDVFKFAIGIEKDFAYTVDIDNGCLVFANKKAIDSVIYRPVEYLNWDFFNEHRKTLLNLITWEEFINLR